MSRWEKIGVVVTLVFIGIPQAAKFYPPLFAGMAEQIPLGLILAWMSRLGLIALGGVAGWYLRGFIEDSKAVTSGEDVKYIEGCIEVEGTCWRGTAELSDGELDFSDVPYKVICPICQTVMFDGEDHIGPSPTYWDCPNCDHSLKYDYGKRQDASKLFERHIRQITESEGEEYSLDNLIDNLDGEADPRGIWEEYTRIVNDENVSLNCFP